MFQAPAAPGARQLSTTVRGVGATALGHVRLVCSRHGLAVVDDDDAGGLSCLGAHRGQAALGEQSRAVLRSHYDVAAVEEGSSRPREDWHSWFGLPWMRRDASAIPRSGKWEVALAWLETARAWVTMSPLRSYVWLQVESNTDGYGGSVGRLVYDVRRANGRNRACSRVRGVDGRCAVQRVSKPSASYTLLEVADVDAETVHVHLRSWPRSAEEGPDWGTTYETLWDLIDLDDLITEFPLDDGTPFRWGHTWGVVVQGELVPIGIGETGERLALAVATSYASNSGSWEWDDFDKFVPTDRVVGSARDVVTEVVAEASKQGAHQQGVREEDSPPPRSVWRVR